MKPFHHRLIRGAAALFLSLGMAGCLDYTFETTVRPDGTGVRVQRMEFTRNDDLEMSADEVRALTLAAPAGGWRTSTRVDADGDTVWVVERTTPVRSLNGWSDLTRDPLILGTTPARADQRLGYVRLGDVVFRSSIQVGVSRRSDGTSLVSYRESFVWDQAADAVVEFMIRDLDGFLRERFPRLTEGDRSAVVGYARARVRVAGEEGLFTGDNEDEAMEAAVAGIAQNALKIVRVRYADVDAQALRAEVARLLVLDDEQAERLFSETLPGLNLGFNTNVVVRLTMPGRVTVTNAHRRDGNTLEWEFSPLDELAGAVEVFAEAELGG
jgi:hypothetical protein